MAEKEKPKVAVLKSTYNNIFDNIEQMIDLLGYTPKKKNIFIKPNLVDAYPPKTGIITSPKVVEAIVKYFKKNFPDSEIVIGDGCALHTKMEYVLNKAGYRYLSDKYGVKLVDLEDAKRTELEWKHGSLKIPEYINTHEYINVAKLKTHCQTSVTLSIKNQKGLLSAKDKKDFHRKLHLHNSVKLLSELVKPDLVIIDGILSLEGRGPIQHGTPKKNTNLIIGSKNMYAADNAAAKIMGFDVAEIEHIPAFADYIEVGEKVSEYIIPFKRSDPSPWIEKNIYFHFDETMCSICGIEIENALKPSFSNLPFVFKSILAGGLSGRKDLITGNLDKLPEGAENTICFGNCAFELSEKNNLPIIKGCPPKIEKIKEQYLEFCKNVKNVPARSD